MSRELAVLVLTEDNGADAHGTVAALARKVLFLLEPGLDPRHLHVDPADARARAGMGFNCYKSRKPRDRDKKQDLALAIARYLLVKDRDAIVFVHVDADLPWSARDQTHLCDNARSFTDEIVRLVTLHLERQHQRHRLQQIAMLIPFWTIESWLYHNTREALRLCQEHPQYRQDIPQFEAWRDAPHLLDEHERPKTTIRFGAKYNLHLASESFPAKHLYEFGLVHPPGHSFTASVEAARPGLQALLAAHTRHAPPA